MNREEKKDNWKVKNNIRQFIGEVLLFTGMMGIMAFFYALFFGASAHMGGYGLLVGILCTGIGGAIWYNAKTETPSGKERPLPDVLRRILRG